MIPAQRFTAAFIFFLLLLPLSGARASELPAVHHELRVRLVPEKKLLEGTDEITLPAQMSGSLTFSLAPRAKILSVRLDGEPAVFRFSQGRLTVQQVPGGNVSRLEIVYRAVFDDPAPSDPVRTEDPSYGVTGTIGAVGVFLAGSAGWYPELLDAPSSFRVRVETPPGIFAVTSGRKVDHSDGPGGAVSEWEITSPVRALALSAGPYRIGEARSGEIPLYTYFYPQSEQFAPTYLKASQKYLDLYTELFGPYPFSKWAVVENFFPTGYGFPSWTLLGSTVVRLPFIVETSLGHEIAHSWWGNGVWVDYSGGNWSEGLTTYVADYLYTERESGEAALEHRLKFLRDYASLVTPERDIPLRSFTSRRSSAEQAIGYGKAAMVFHMARQRVGDEAFWKGLRQVAEKRMFQRAAWGDFAQALENASGMELDDFFRQWVERPGAPQLALENVRLDESDEGWRVSGTLRQSSSPFKLYIPLRLQTDEGTVEITVPSRETATPFALESPARPRLLEVDPDAHLFRRLDPVEIPPTVNGVRGAAALLVVASDRLSAEDRSAARLLLEALGQENANIRGESMVSPADLQGRDVLFIGIPSRTELLPSFPQGFSLEAGRPVLQNAEYSDPRSAVFAALPHPFDKGRTAAVFISGSPEAGRDAARRIPHYGRYSYLAFVEGRNVDKGIWPVIASPLIHRFD